MDAYVSHKLRKNTTNLFGFVRFGQMEEARRAITNLHGIEIHGCKLLMQIAAYDRFHRKKQYVRRRVMQRYRTKNIQSTRVRKTFKEVLIRRNEKVEANEMNVHNGHSS